MDRFLHLHAIIINSAGMTVSMSGPSTSTDVCLPYVSLQPDFAQVYTDVAQGIRRVERAWLSVYCLNAPRASIHAKLLLTNGAASDGVDIDLEAAFTTQLNMQKADEARVSVQTVMSTVEQNSATEDDDALLL